jgi:hypothetical protein
MIGAELFFDWIDALFGDKLTKCGEGQKLRD